MLIVFAYEWNQSWVKNGRQKSANIMPTCPGPD